MEKKLSFNDNDFNLDFEVNNESMNLEGELDTISIIKTTTKLATKVTCKSTCTCNCTNYCSILC
ncbi:hypothetical protein CEY02_19975 [Bacillus pumilus]|uniref:Uncharacterized protein n=1 Tax=Bacillus pumilus TaxID=1408 RepID=A0A2A5IJB2_BACPU|nr:hypothetical protein CEY02_19975 [Bacillus pumilus]